jgi:hypothetical protein
MFYEIAFYLVLNFMNGQSQILGPFTSDIRCKEVQDAMVLQVESVRGAMCVKVRHQHGNP